MNEEIQHGNAVQTVVELCAIRDGVADCDTLSFNDVCNLIDLISLEYIFKIKTFLYCLIIKLIYYPCM